MLSVCNTHFNVDLMNWKAQQSIGMAGDIFGNETYDQYFAFLCSVNQKCYCFSWTGWWAAHANKNLPILISV